jgi:hypothetical protein
LNLIVTLFVGRRLYRLRRSSPAVIAVLEHPETVVGIHGWPEAAPPGKLPPLIVITTKDGAKCALPVDDRHVLEVAAALRLRSPEAMFGIGNVPRDVTMPEARAV